MFFIKDSYFISEKIGHEKNGDRALSLCFETKPATSNKISVYCVLDGVSTANDRYASSLASVCLCSELSKVFADVNEVGRMDSDEKMLYFYSVMRQAILAADKSLFEDENYCATTVSMAIVHEKYVYTANIGDSPILFLDLADNTLTELYTSHSEAAAAVRRGEIDKSEMHTYKKKNIISKAVGGKARLEELDVPTRRTLLSEDGILLLGSDGALSVFSAEVLKEELLNNADNMKDFCEKHFDKVKEAGGKDDFTLMAHRISAWI